MTNYYMDAYEGFTFIKILIAVGILGSIFIVALLESYFDL